MQIGSCIVITAKNKGEGRLCVLTLPKTIIERKFRRRISKKEDTWL